MSAAKYQPKRTRPTARRSARHQHGAVLFVALIVLVAMTLAGLALIRTADMGALIAGNLAFKRNALHSAEIGAEAARTWMMGKTSTELQTDDGNAYYSSWSSFDPKTYDWVNKSTLVVDKDAAGNTIRYVVHRMCQSNGAASGIPCVTVQAGAGASTKRGAHYGEYPLSGGVQPYYRVTVRAEGPRGTVSYTQSFVY
jgi:type IV pilus assembly protein PilX